jgi:KipI family sensor histidine kinase inhibitor
MPTQPELRLLPAGDAALTVEFGDSIDPAINARVLALDSALRDRPWLIETVPTYRSLLIYYDAAKVDFADLSADLLRLAAAPAASQDGGRTWTIPVAYGGEHGIDLEATAATHGITPEELVRRHSAPVYQVYMMGFLPGFAYLGGLDPTIATPRRVSPRLKTPPGTISIGGVQALVASIEAPSGWHLLGRTPVRNFMPGRDPVFLVQPGDRVRFRPIEERLFRELDEAAAAGAVVAEPTA